MEQTVICKQITKTFGKEGNEVEALRGVDLELGKKEILMIVGPSGSGKTTLISIIAGILKPTDGQVFALDQEIGQMHNAELTHFRGKNIGFVFQAFNLIPTLTIRENVSVPLILNGRTEDEALAIAKETLERLGLADKLDQYPQNLSGGQQQRVAIARGTIHNPQLIVCDEPTSSLDSETGAMVMELFKEEVEKRECSLIIVTHDERIFSFADRIVRIEDGHLRS